LVFAESQRLRRFTFVSRFPNNPTGTSCCILESETEVTMIKTLRRAIFALSLAGITAAVLRIKGKGGVPPQQGGWREITPPK
jgi:hypothetical protein